jgi:mono/diheme cytochrome c family protein
MRIRLIGLIAFALALVGLSQVERSATVVAQDKGKTANAVEKVIAPFVAQHCIACHGPQKKKADLQLHVFKDEASILKARKTWMAVLSMLHAGEMPPSGRPRPPIGDAEQFAKAVTEIFDRHDRTAKRDPGKVTMRRLNRVEYVNTIRDLIGIDIPIGEDFPSDDVGHGFDNIGDVLTISPLHMERYLAASEMIMKNAIVVGEAPKPLVRTTAARFMEPGATAVERPRILYTKGPLYATFNVKQAGECKIVVRMSGRQAGDEPVKASILFDGQEVKTVSMAEKKGNSGRNHTVTVNVAPGEHKVGVTLLNEYTDPDDDSQGRGVIIEYVQFVGPIGAPPDSQLALLEAPANVDEEAKTRHILSRFASRAYRRPATKDEIDRLIKIVHAAEEGKEPWEGAVSLAMQAVLVSPKFLFRVELDATPDSKDAHPIDDYQLASRLSYFLWSTMPDQELLDLAAKKQLHQNIESQVKRMLRDGKAVALTDNFASQWLQLRPLKTHAPDKKLFPEFDERLRSDMLKETDLFFQAIAKEDRSILDLIDGPFTFVNERLAKHYRIRDTNGNPFLDVAIRPPGEPITGEKFVRVNLEGTKRGGLLTQASVLTVTSNPTRTSPVKRGRWVLEQILGTPPPPPPPDVPELPSSEQTKGTLRQRMEQHRVNPSCAGCHARMDPIGFAFENFSAIGKYRTSDEDLPIDSTGELPNGQKFQGPNELKAILKGKKELFSRCLTEKMLTYAIGRGVEFYDKPAIDGILAALEKNEYRFSRLITEIAKSDPFRLRRGKDQE